MRTFRILFLASILLIATAFAAQAAGQDSTDKTGALTVPWDDFKRLLNLDDDEIVISWETFQKLLAMTDVEYVPLHTVKGGNVVLTRDEFDSLVARMKLPVHTIEGRPVDYLITRALYGGRMNSSSTLFTGTFKVHVLKENAFVKIPIIPASVPLEDITVNGQPALVINENGYHTIVLSRPGQYDVEASFSLASSLEKGPYKIDLAILPTPITLLSLEMPLKDIEIEIPQAQQVVTTSKGNTTIVKAAIVSGNSMSIRWRKKIAPTEKVPAKLHADLYHLISIEDGAMNIGTDINLNILYSEIDAVRVWIPKGLHILSVTGEGIGEWQEATQDGRSLIVVPFTYGKKGPATIRLTAEIPTSETGLGNVFSGITVDETVREKGFVGIVLNTSAEVSVADSENLEPVAPQRLPVQLINKSAKPLTMGFKYLKQPYSLVLNIKKHDKIAVPVAVINSANVVTLFTEDGKIVHRIVYQVKNSSKQFLHVRLPEGSALWSVLVDNQPMEPSVNDKGELLVPLIRSRTDGTNLEDFPVEIIFCTVEDKFAAYGSRGSTLPSVDLMISQVMWSVYLPNDYIYHYFSSSLEIEQMVRGVNLLSGPRRQYDERVMRELSESSELDAAMPSVAKLNKAYGDKEFKSQFRNVPAAPEQLMSQVKNELEFSGRMDRLSRGGAGYVSTGVLPIQIQVPTGGQVYRFARTIINPDDPLTFEVTYSRSWMTGMLKYVIALIAVLVLWFVRRRFKRLGEWIIVGVKNAISFYVKHERAIRSASQSVMTPVVLFGLVLVFSMVSMPLAGLCFLLFWVSTAWHVVRFLRKKSTPPAKLDKAAPEDGAAG